MNENDTVNLTDDEAYFIITNINNNLEEIKDSTNNIDSNIIDIIESDDLKERKQIEQKSEKTTGEKKEETEEEEQSREVEQSEEEESSITLETISAQIETTNTLIQDNNNLMTVSIFSQGILIGVLLLTLFWRRLVK